MGTANKVLLIGASGFLGTALKNGLKNFDTGILKARDIYKMNPQILAELLNPYDAIVNLAGYPVNKRWTSRNKRKILESRILISEKISLAIMQTGKKIFLVNASAIGIYRADKVHDENSVDFGDNFLASVVSKWEETLKVLDPHTYCIVRIGVVLGRDGGAYPLLRKMVRLNFGAYFNGGKQKLSFILIDDLVNAIEFILNKQIHGIVNLTAPDSISYREMILQMRKNLSAFMVWNLPGFMLKLLLGKASILILEGAEIIPGVLLKNNFNFVAPDFESCMQKLERS